MPLLFLITYITILYFIYKKNKNNTNNFRYLLKINGIIAFALLFVFIIYFDESTIGSEQMIKYSFFFLILSYFITYVIFLIKYRKIICEEKIVEKKEGKLELISNNIFYIILIFLSVLPFYFNYKMGFNYDTYYRNNNFSLYSMLISFIVFFSVFYLIVERKILGCRK